MISHLIIGYIPNWVHQNYIQLQILQFVTSIFLGCFLLQKTPKSIKINSAPHKSNTSKIYTCLNCFPWNCHFILLFFRQNPSKFEAAKNYLFLEVKIGMSLGISSDRKWNPKMIFTLYYQEIWTTHFLHS
jgi:hypothetical protein